MVRFLVANGAEVQPVDASGRTPRDMARGNHELAITEARPDPLVETVALLEVRFGRQTLHNWGILGRFDGSSDR